MTRIKRTISIPADRRIRFEKPPKPLTQAEFEAGKPCPLCEYYGHKPNAETIAAMEEGEAILRGEIPGIRFDSAEEMFRYLEI